MFYCCSLFFFYYYFLLILCRDLGVHVDGFIANVAHSFVVGASKVRMHLKAQFWSQSLFSCYSFFSYFCRRTPSQAGKLMSSKRLICVQKQLFVLSNLVIRYRQLFTHSRHDALPCMLFIQRNYKIKNNT